jgi:3-oxoacyl-[acyl-carrier protein] reductase
MRDGAVRETVLITGTRKGIGRHLVDHFLAQGTVVGCSRDAFEGPPPDGYTTSRPTCATRRRSSRWCARRTASLGSISVLINNAGIASMNHLLLTPKSTIERVFATNVFGSFVVMREVAKLMSSARTAGS